MVRGAIEFACIITNLTVATINDKQAVEYFGTEERMDILSTLQHDCMGALQHGVTPKYLQVMKLIIGDKRLHDIDKNYDAYKAAMYQYFNDIFRGKVNLELSDEKNLQLGKRLYSFRSKYCM